jgi:ABC-type multidrug transport system ATPase subunit
MDEFVPQRTSAYIGQHDLHIGEMTVRETLAFSARCQGVGTRYGMLHVHWKGKRVIIHNCVKRFLWLFHITDMLSELSRREKEANIKPDPDIDVYMKVG